MKLERRVLKSGRRFSSSGQEKIAQKDKILGNGRTLSCTTSIGRHCLAFNESQSFFTTGSRYEEGVKRRRQGLEQSSSGHQSHVSTSFNSLFEWFPAQVDSNEVAVAVMRRLRSKVGGGDPDTFQKWITITPADVLKKEFAVALKELGL